MKVVIFVDSRYRDTLGCLLVKKELQKLRKHWDVLTVTIDLWKEVMDLYQPHIVVLNHAIGMRNREIIRRAKYSIVLPTEGRPNTEEQENWFVSQQDGVADLYLSWNETIANKFQETKTVVTGCPRFDVYHNRTDLIDSKQKARAKYGLNPHKKTVGIFTSFPQAKFAFQNTKFNEKDWKDLGVTDISTRANPLEFANQELLYRQQFMNAVDAFATEFRDKFSGVDYQYLVKPHPMEDVVQIQQWCDEQGYTCITQDTIFNVISACDYVINRIGCITSIDAALMNVPVIAYGDPEDVGIAADIEHIARHARTPSQLIEAQGTLENGVSLPQEYIALCGLNDSAAHRVARAIVNNVPKMSGDASVRNLITLQMAIQKHNWQHMQLNINAGAVGKAATSGYLNSWEARL